MMRYEAFVFDLDGTLVGTSEEGRYAIVGKALQDLGVNPTQEDVDKIWFGSDRNFVIREIFQIEPEVFWQHYKRYNYPEFRLQYTQAYHDISAILDLRKKGFKTAIVSGAEPKTVEAEVTLLGAHNFDAIISAHSSAGMRPKPNPESLEKCLHEMKAHKRWSVYVGNADEDITAARAAGMLDVIVDRKEYSCAERPSVTINTLYELSRLMK